MGNSVAYFALFAWPVVVYILFRRLPVPQALVWSILGGYLFLPERTGIDFPVLPAFDKQSIPALSAIVMLWLQRDKASPAERRAQSPRATERRAGSAPTRRDTQRTVKRRGGQIIVILVAIAILVHFAMWYTNREPVIAARKFLPPMRIYDSFSLALTMLIGLLPFLLARKHLASPEAHRAILKAVALAGLAYSVLALIEVRLSPQLNSWIYGFFPHSFRQHMRDGGFRPILFLEHGLRVGIFLTTAVLSSIALFRLREGRNPGQWLLVAGFILLVLLLSKNLGAVLIVLVFLPGMLILNVTGRSVFAAILAGTLLLYPALREFKVIPIEPILSFARSISPERAGSLEFRLDNEDALLARAMQKPLFGWGGWNRNAVQSAKGRTETIADGLWISQIGVTGWVGYIAIFGLLTLPPILLAMRSRQLALDDATSCLILVLTANLVDLIPNSSLVPITWLMAGALAGRYELSIASMAGPGARRNTSRRPAPPGRRPPPGDRRTGQKVVT